MGSPRLCFVAHNALGELAEGYAGHIGGVERQTALMAKWLTDKGTPVSMATWAAEGGGDLLTGGVEHIPLCRREAGLPGLRFFHPRWTSLYKALRRADADVYYHNGAEYVTGQIALWCRRNGRKFVYSTANDTDCDRRLPEMRTFRERVLYRYGLRRADAIVTQTQTQQEMLYQGFGRESVVIPMPCVGPTDSEYLPPELPTDGPPRVLWIGRLCRQKRPDRLLDVAKACPDIHFDMVGPTYPSHYARAQHDRAERAVNVTLHGPIDRSRVGRFYRQATCMCSTSDFEGFPNTFLEAWSHGLPLVTTFDPDGLVVEHGLGDVAADTAEIVESLGALFASPGRYRRWSDNARSYYLGKHTIAAVMPRFQQVFTDVLKTT